MIKTRWQKIIFFLFLLDILIVYLWYLLYKDNNILNETLETTVRIILFFNPSEFKSLGCHAMSLKQTLFSLNFN